MELTPPIDSPTLLGSSHKVVNFSSPVCLKTSDAVYYFTLDTLFVAGFLTYRQRMLSICSKTHLQGMQPI